MAPIHLNFDQSSGGVITAENVKASCHDLLEFTNNRPRLHLFSKRKRNVKLMILAAALTAGGTMSQENKTSSTKLDSTTLQFRKAYDFYDELRKSPTANFRPMYEPKPSVGRVLHIVSDPVMLGVEDESEENTTITLCHVPIFLDYSIENMDTHGFQDVSHLSYGGTAGALLAIHHFNNGDGTIVKDLEGINDLCDIRLTTEVVDTQSSPIVAVQNLANKITYRKDTDVEVPQACAVMGAALYTVSQSMASFTGVYDLLQVSPSSSSMSLDSMAQYPLFSRTHPSDEAKGRLAIEYFDKVLNVKHFGIFFVNNELGLSLQKTILDAALERGMTARSVSFPDNPSDASLRNSLRQLNHTKLNYFIGVFFPMTYEVVMGIALEEGVAGPGKFWLTTGHLADSFAGGNTTVVANSNAAIGSTGMAILHDDGGPGLDHYDKFLREWRKLQDNKEALDYINSKQPRGPEGTNISFTREGDYFSLRPSHYSQFSYDAIAAIGLAACNAAQNSTLNDNYFTGKEHHQSLIDKSFLGASGNVKFPNNSFTRDGYSVYYFVSEIHEIGRSPNNPALSIFSGETKLYFDIETQSWKRSTGADEYIYAGNTTVRPNELPPYQEQMHSLTTSVQLVCLFLAVAVIITSISLAVYVFIHQKNQVITASQPPFLYIICTGTLVLSSSIIPLTVDDSVATDIGCSVACMSRIWLMSIGFTITFSALFSKTWRINKLVRKARGFKRIQLSAADVTVPFLILFGLNLLILTLWTVMAPLEWKRESITKDEFDRTVESLGNCYSPNWLPYGVSLFLVNGLALLLAISEAYKARNINTEFSESRYIGMAVVCIFQALFFGVPLFFIAKDWPTAQIFVLAAVIFIICMAVLLLIFVPKIILIQHKALGARSNTSNSVPSNSQRANVMFPRQSVAADRWGLVRHSAPTAGGVRVSHGSSSYNRGAQSMAALQATTLNILNMHQAPEAIEGQNVYGGHSRGGGSFPTSVTSSTIGLEEEIWNSTHLDGLNRLQNELTKACIQIQSLQQEIDALNWSSKSRNINRSFMRLSDAVSHHSAGLNGSAVAAQTTSLAKECEHAPTNNGYGSSRSSVTFADERLPLTRDIKVLHDDQQEERFNVTKIEDMDAKTSSNSSEAESGGTKHGTDASDEV